MGLWDSVTGFFSDLADFFSGKSFFESAGYMWNDLMKMARNILVQNPAEGTYAGTWGQLKDIHTTLNVVAASLLILFFLYGFCKESVDLHTEMTFDRTVKLFVRLIIASNAMTYAMTWIPEFLGWGQALTGAILGSAKFGFYFDGAKIYDELAGADWGTMVAFMTSILFFLFTVICGFMIIFSVLTRIIKIYLMVPFCGLALSTLAAGGQISQIGYSYIRTFFGQIGQAMLIAVAIVISSTFVDTITIETENAILILVEYCLKMLAITGAVKGSEQLQQKIFNL